MKVTTTVATKNEVAEICVWYEKQRRGLGQEFFAEYESSIDRIQAAPLQFAKLEQRPKGSEVRRYLLDRFPYLIVYQVLETEIVVLAVMHAHRSLRGWRKRLK